jgi:hypothetical protein
MESWYPTVIVLVAMSVFLVGYATGWSIRDLEAKSDESSRLRLGK